MGPGNPQSAILITVLSPDRQRRAAIDQVWSAAQEPDYRWVPVASISHRPKLLPYNSARAHTPLQAIGRLQARFRKAVQ